MPADTIATEPFDDKYLGDGESVHVAATGGGWVYSVYDWAWTDETGQEHYARTPERAIRLKAEGHKLTPLYVRDSVSLPVADTNRTIWSFDDNFIGTMNAGGRALQTRDMARLPHLTTQVEWYTVAGKLCRAANVAPELLSSLKMVMALIGGYPETVPNELGLSAWRSIQAGAFDAIAKAEGK